jgi:hypothetical protein
LPVKGNSIALYQLSTATGFHLTIDFHFAKLNQNLGFTACLCHSSPLEELVKPDGVVIFCHIALPLSLRLNADTHSAQIGKHCAKFTVFVRKATPTMDFSIELGDSPEGDRTVFYQVALG